MEHMKYGLQELERLDMFAQESVMTILLCVIKLRMQHE